MFSFCACCEALIKVVMKFNFNEPDINLKDFLNKALSHSHKSTVILLSFSLHSHN